MEYLTAILVFVTCIYVWITNRILKANKEVIKVTQDELEIINRPYIVVAPKVQSGNPISYLTIANIGKTPATNVRLKISDSFYQYGQKESKRNLSNFSVFSKAIEGFAPGSEIIIGLAEGFVIFDDKKNNGLTPAVFSIKATYCFAGKEVSEETTIDLRPYEKSQVSFDAIASELEGIKKTLKEFHPYLKKI